MFPKLYNFGLHYKIMSMKKLCIQLTLVVALISLTAYSASIFEPIAPPSLADLLHTSRSKDPVDGGWLPNLAGLPDYDQVLQITNQLTEPLENEDDPECASIDIHLRMAVFQHFVIHQLMANNQNIYFDENMAHKWAKILAMTLKESSGDSNSITDMKGHSLSTYNPHTNLQHWQNILNLGMQNHIKLNYQTNFGLTQTSADRLFDAFKLAQNQTDDTQYLEGKYGELTDKKIALNTAIAIRRLIWFYQDFAQGRLVQSDKRIHQQDINLPKYSSRYKAGLKMALLYCGTRFLFDKEHGNSEEDLERAMASIAYCKLGNAQSGYGKNEIDELCFAEWVTLCPALNIDIASLTPLSYFETRAAKPVCEKTFMKLITPKPAN